MSLNRRAFLSATASAAVATTLSSAPVHGAPISRTGKSQLRVGLAAYSMRQYLQAKPGRLLQQLRNGGRHLRASGPGGHATVFVP